MKFASLFSGIGGFDRGFERAGMECVLQVENDKDCLKLLRVKWPDVPKQTDVRGLEHAGTVDLLCGGFPCQDLSVAGQRRGLAGDRSGLWFEFRRIIAESRPGWVVVENVPGLLSSNEGRDFAVILRGLVELGYGVAWRILDSQWFGVPQRRRRVFIVGHLGDGRATQVLFEPEGLCRDTPPRREAGTEAAHTVRASTGSRGTDDPDRMTFVATARAAMDRPDDGESETFVIRDAAMPLAKKQNGIGVAQGPMYTLDGHGAHGVFSFEAQEDLAYALSNPAGGGRTDSRQLLQGSAVRRLTPTECERLQSFPDGYTAGFADSVRYRMLGNAVTVNVATWIGRRIMALLSSEDSQ